MKNLEQITEFGVLKFNIKIKIIIELLLLLVFCIHILSIPFVVVVLCKIS
jgi:hypothetical protein